MNATDLHNAEMTNKLPLIETQVNELGASGANDQTFFNLYSTSKEDSPKSPFSRRKHGDS